MHPHLQVFEYTVQEGDRDEDGIGIPATALILNGGTIALAADNTIDADLTHAAANGACGRPTRRVPVSVGGPDGDGLCRAVGRRGSRPLEAELREHAGIRSMSGPEAAAPSLRYAPGPHLRRAGHADRLATGIATVSRQFPLAGSRDSPLPDRGR